MSLIQITIIGRLGRDAEVRMTKTGKEIVSANVAASSGKDKSQWFNVQAWEKTGNWLKEAKKGDQIWASGTLEVRNYEKKTGGVGTELIVTAQQVRVFSKSAGKPNDIPEVQGSFSLENFDEDVPF